MFKEELGELHEGELRTLLNDLLQLADPSAAKGNEDRILADRIWEIWSDRLEKSRKAREEAEKRRNHVHLICGLSDAGTLKVTLSELGMRQTVEVIAFNDLFSIGPIMNLDTPEGQQFRRQWLSERFPSFDRDQMHNRDHQIANMMQVIAKIPEHKSITIWFANNAHDQVGLRFALYLLRNRTQPVQIINASEVCNAFGADAKGKSRRMHTG